MRTITVKNRQSLYLKIFESIKFDCIIFVYLDKNDKVISFNYHWGTDEIQTKYIEFNGHGEATQLYRMFLDVFGNHSAKIYDMVIGAQSITNKTKMQLGIAETDLAELKLENKTLKGKLDKIKSLSKQ